MQKGYLCFKSAEILKLVAKYNYWIVKVFAHAFNSRPLNKIVNFKLRLDI